MLSFFQKLIDTNQRDLGRYRKIVDQINNLGPKLKKLTDKQITERSLKLRAEIQKGRSLTDALPEAFALVREAAERRNKTPHYDVQFMAAMVLHDGKIAEQKTGEGKTLSATPAVYLNGMTGKGVHVVTVNDYLARRDCGWMGPIYNLLGLTCATIIHEQSFIYDPKFKDPNTTDPRLKNLRPVTRKEAYAADITYGTNNEFGFDYLRDNMVQRLENQVQRGHFYAIVDEVDSILIDEARTPLIISAPSNEPTARYTEFAQIIDQLTPDDYVLDEKMRTSNLTEDGILKIEKLLGIDNLYEKDFATLHHIEEALKAKTLFTKDKDYVVSEGEVVIVDEFTGRLMPGRRYSEGLHQAIEAKEGVTIQQETKTWATISFQNYFRLYEKLAGMTGTAATEAEEFHKIYNLDVVVMPTHRAMVRKDMPDAIFKTHIAKYQAVVEEIARVHETGQPILVGTTSIEKNEYLSDLLKKKRVSHALLNAKNHQKEAEIISKAGEKGAVTVATNLAGRGVDIKLGKGIDKLGGLYVLGTERHESRRIDNQLRGRSGRQGDPGYSKFYVSLEDDLMRIFGGEQVASVMNFLKVPDDMPIENGMVSKALEGAQKKVEGHNFDARKHTVEYDDVMNQQRKIIYGVRRQILETMESKAETIKEEILEKIENEIQAIVTIHTAEGADHQKIIDDFTTIIIFDSASKASLLQEISKLGSAEQLSEFLINIARELYEAREKQLGPESMRQLETVIYLTTIDTLWVEHLDTVEDLRMGIGLRGYAQKDPLVEYKKEAFDLFEKLIASIDSTVVHRIYKESIVGVNPQPVIDISQAIATHDEALGPQDILEATGQFLSPMDRDNQPKVRIDRPDKVANNSDGHVSAESSSYTEGATTVKVERGGEVISQQTLGLPTPSGQSVPHKKPGRNDPCWCGSGKKYKKCHYPN